MALQKKLVMTKLDATIFLLQVKMPNTRSSTRLKEQSRTRSCARLRERCTNITEQRTSITERKTGASHIFEKAVHFAVKYLKDPSGSSLTTIKEYLSSKFNYSDEKLGPVINHFLVKAVKEGKLLLSCDAGSEEYRFKIPDGNTARTTSAACSSGRSKGLDQASMWSMVIMGRWSARKCVKSRWIVSKYKFLARTTK